MNENDFDSQAAVGILTGGPMGVTHTLNLSFASEEELEANWAILQRCTRWRLSVEQHGEHPTLKLSARGEPVPLAPWMAVGKLALLPVGVLTYEGEWEMAHISGVGFFLNGARKQGYFAILAAVRKVLTNRRPIVAFISTKGEQTDVQDLDTG